MQNAVTRWFGPEFPSLHPLLQRLHKQGGKLQGKVAVRFGSGIAGWLGRRLARRLGIPPREGEYPFSVHIWHEQNALHWDRVFNDFSPMCSVFTPVGTYPQGHWQESTGKLQLQLGVEIKNGEWYWVQQGVRLGWLPIPLWLVPESSAHKYIEEGKYQFQVAFSFRWLGRLFSYGGSLHALAP